ncbi:MAG: hypothetical protein QXU74_01075 [Candidatus Aenigmatarchaeota archaeon]
MIFPESFPIFYSLGLVILFSSTIFFWRFFVFKRKLLLSLYSLPSIVVLGTRRSGKSSFIKVLTSSQIVSHPVQNGLNFSTLTIGNQKIQLIEVPHFANGATNHLRKFREMKLIGGFYLFDVSKESDPPESQLENYEKIKEFFSNIPLIPIANKMDIADREKLEKIKSRFKEIHEIQLTGELDKMKQDLLKKEAEDLKQLIYNITREIETERKI